MDQHAAWAEGDRRHLESCRQTGSYRSTRKSPCSPVICTHRLHAARMYASGAIWRKMSPPRNLSIIRIRAGGQFQGGGTMAQRRQRGWLKKETRIQGETWVVYFRTTRKFDGRRVENKIPIGLVRDFPDKSSAWAEGERLHFPLKPVDSRRGVTF